jgi:diaminopimelate epimerase
MRIRFSKMHGAGNDFVVVDGVRQTIELTTQQWRFLADRHFGVGADQILLVEKASQADVDFNYRIFNANGAEVEHCGNGARCFVRFVNEQGLSNKSRLRVKTVNGVLTLNRIDESRVQVDMGEPLFDHAQLPFAPKTLANEHQHDETLWTIPIDRAAESLESPAPTQVQASVISMGNPHATIEVANAASFSVRAVGPAVQARPEFPAGVNVGFMQVINRQQIALRVYERGSGETIACGTGACAAVVSGIRRGLLDRTVNVLTRGGALEIQWLPNNHSNLANRVLMTGPTQTVFTGEIELPEQLQNFHEQPLP